MNRSATIRTLFLVGLLGGLFLTSGAPVSASIPAAALWLFMAFGAEGLWHRGRLEGTTLSMGPAVQVAAVSLLPAGAGVAVAAASAGLGEWVWRRAGAAAVLRYAGVVLVASTAAWGGAAALSAALPGAVEASLPVRTAAVTLSGILFHAARQGVTAAWLSRGGSRRTWSAWRLAFGSTAEMVTTWALIVVALLSVVCFEALGLRGTLLCATPLLFVHDGSRRYLQLLKAQDRIVRMERLAAKGEMAAEIGHELNNYLAAVSGRAQLLAMSPFVQQDERLAEETSVLRNLAVTMAGLARGLMDFSHRDTVRARFAVNELVERTVALVRPQARFRNVEFQLATDPGAPEVEIDPGQIQQALLTLLRRAAGRDRSGTVLRIGTSPGLKPRTVAIEISGRSSGEEPPPAAATNDDSGRGEIDSDLGTVDRIARRHRGQLEVDRPADREASFRLILPAA